MTNIESKNNNRIKDLVRLRDDPKFRNDKSLFYIEGERLFKDTPKDLVQEIYIRKDKYNYYANILSAYNDQKIYILANDVYDKVIDTVNSQGIIATVKYKLVNGIDANYLDKINSCIILDSISDPGNLGTIFRVAEAAKVDLIIIANRCCNIYNTKVTRASMSSIFRNNIYISEDIVKTIELLQNYGLIIYATSLNKPGIKYSDVDYKDKFAIVFGNEANGISSDILNLVSHHIYIPMQGDIESLNVAISTSIILYEAMRQNKFYENQ